MKYLLDSNIFIEPKNSYYGFSLCPGFWDWLKTCTDVGSVSAVRDELLEGNDYLVSWIKTELKTNRFFNTKDIDIQECYQKIVDFVDGEPFDNSVKQSFYACADGWLIAAAMAKNATIVTHERVDFNVRRRISIPYVANHFSIHFIRLFDLLREYKVRFILDSSSLS